MPSNSIVDQQNDDPIPIQDQKQQQFHELSEFEDCGEWISTDEHRVRRFIDWIFRLCLGTFFSAQLFDFLFNPIWMHGYIWALNQQTEVDLADKPAGDILEYQLANCGWTERVVLSVISTAAVMLILWVAKYHESNRTVWELFRLSVTCGVLSGLIRTLQTRQRLYSVVHEIFYVYLHIFVVGICLTCRITERHFVQKNEKQKLD